MTDLRIGRGTGAGPVADIRVPLPRRPADPTPPVADGVELSRLLRLAGLTPAQAVEVGADLLAAVAGRSGPGADCDQVIVDRVVIGADGVVVLRPDPDRWDGGAASALRPSGMAVGVLLDDITRAARLRARRPGPAAGPLLAELDRAVAELLVAGVPAAARTLGEAAAGADRGAVRAELAALAQAVGRHAGQAHDAGPAGRPATAIRPDATPRATGVERNARRLIGAWVLSILVLVGIVLLEYALLRDKVATDIGVLLDAGRGEAPPSAAPEPDGLPVVPPAPAAAGSVRGVDLRPLAECTPGVPCSVRVLVRVVPGAGPQVVTWSYRVVDRCTGAVVPAPGGSVAVPAGQERVAVVGTVALPAAPAVALVAVTDVPAVAASAPVLLGTCGPGTG